MIRALVIAAVGSLLAATALQAQAVDAQNVDRGKAVYQKWCMPCHGSNQSGRGRFGGTGFPGTDALAVKYKGRNPAIPSALEERTDLSPAAVKLFVRQGVSVMPFFRKTEVSDADLADLTAYLMRNRPPQTPPAQR
jgi:mono/diheme cytochrome c family protein